MHRILVLDDSCDVDHLLHGEQTRKMERKADVKEIVNEAIAYESLSRSRALSSPSFSPSPVPSDQRGQRQTDRSDQFRQILNDERRASSARYRRYPPPTKRRDRQTRGTSYARAERLRNRRRESSVFDRLGATRRSGRHYQGMRHFHRRRHKPYDSIARTEDNLSVKGSVFHQNNEKICLRFQNQKKYFKQEKCHFQFKNIEKKRKSSKRKSTTKRTY